MELHVESFIKQEFPQGGERLTQHAVTEAMRRRGMKVGPNTMRVEREDGIWLVGLVPASAAPAEAPDTAETPRG